MDSNADIFITRDSLNAEQLSYTDIQNMIPQNNEKSRRAGWRNSKLTEWRWRFYQFNGKKFAEISYIKYNEDYRTFLTNNKIWVKKKGDPYYPNELVEEFYYYCN